MLATDFQVRELKSHDRRGVVSIIEKEAVLTPEEKDCAVELLDIYLNRLDGDYRFLVAGDSFPIGYICYGKTPLTQGTFDIYWIVVDPVHRLKGVGRSLMEHAEEEVRNLGASLLRAETSSLPIYRDTRDFYERCGYSEEARIRDFYKPGDDLIMYVKRLPGRGAAKAGE